MAGTTADKQPTARLFVALDLPDEARRKLAAWQSEALAGHGSLRLVAPEALHATLVFLGHLPESSIPAVEEAALAPVATLAAPTMSFAGVRPLPRGKPRLFAVDLDDPGEGSTRVYDAVSRSLEAAGLHEPELRKFWPHVTVARVGSRRPDRIMRRIDPPGGDPFACSEVAVYRSRLGQGGARYERLAARTLGG